MAAMAMNLEEIYNAVFKVVRTTLVENNFEV